jgi:hypothetical protein
LGYAPTEVELIASWDRGLSLDIFSPSWKEVKSVLYDLVKEKRVIVMRGRCVFPGQESLVFEHERRETFFPRKIRRAKQVVDWLSRLAGVRFVALCNTTALAHARDESDLDFFIVTRNGTLWQTRGLAALPFKLLGLRPHASEWAERDAVCFSFFVDDTALDLTSLQLPSDDPYFRHWFLSLLPLYDDGVGDALWKANTSITHNHPLALQWISHLELTKNVPLIRIPTMGSLEKMAKRLQSRVLPRTVQLQANQATHVVIGEHVLKLHTTDNREAFRNVYRQQCEAYGVEL